MIPPCCLDDEELPLILDASVIINLTATKRGEELLSMIPNQCFVVEQVVEEILRGASNGREGASEFHAILERKFLHQVPIDPNGSDDFEALVSGHSVATLDDGEAATIAHAKAIGGVAVIDEKKANAICRDAYPELSTASTVDLLSHPRVLSGFCESVLREMTLNALLHARMNILPHQEDWVLMLIGDERARQCTTLRRILRRRDG